MSFRQDQYLKTIVPALDRYDLFSFDVFDTLLFRTCAAPGDIFTRVGQRLCGEADFPYAPAAYRALRVEASRRAKQRRLQAAGTRECSYTEIFEEMPFSAELRQKMLTFEKEEERRAHWLNPAMAELLKHCKQQGKTVVLCSDMYFSGAVILDFLAAAGLDTGLVDLCLSSSDHGVDKRSGGLFRILLEKYPDIPPQRMLHIGDNQLADIDGAASAGLGALHYPVVPQPFGNLYALEQQIYGARLGEIATLRKLAAAGCPYPADSHQAALFAAGAQVIGPVCALFARWVAGRAERLGAKTVLCLMREGGLLSRVIKKELARQGLQIGCKTFSSSRHPLFAASVNGTNYVAKLNQLLIKPQVSVGALMEDIGLEAGQSLFATQANRALDELKTDGLLDDLKDWLHQPNTRQKILDYATTQRRRFIRYLHAETGGAPALTVDIGTKGTSQALMRDILAMEEVDAPRLDHLIMLGAPARNVTNIMDGLSIDGWLGIAGENAGPITAIMYSAAAVETLLSTPVGTVLRYADKDGRIEPVLDVEETELLRPDVPGVEACWQGAEAFQALWFHLLERKPWLEELAARKRGILAVWQRFIELPTPGEAKAVGGMLHYDRFSWKDPIPLCDFALPPGASAEEAESYLAKSRRKNCIWPAAAVAAARPAHHLEKLALASSTPAVRKMLEIIQEIKQSADISDIVVYAAAQRGQDFAALAKSLELPIRCFADSDTALQGRSIAGLPVKALAQLGEGPDAFVVASFLYADEISADIRAFYAGRPRQPRIFSF